MSNAKPTGRVLAQVPGSNGTSADAPSVTRPLLAGPEAEPLRTWQPVGVRGTLYGRIALEIERYIEAHQLQTGDRLPPERELARLLGVSRPSVREAIKRLEANGRLVVKHGTGVWIQPPDAIRRIASPRDVGKAELFAMREVLEVPAAGWAAESPDRAGARALLDWFHATEAAEAAASIDEVHRIHVEFHLRIAELAGNRFLLRTTGVLLEMMGETRELTLHLTARRARARLEHGRIAEAIALGDASAARRAMRVHIRYAQEEWLKRIVEDPA